MNDRNGDSEKGDGDSEKGVLPCLIQMGMLLYAEPPCTHTQYLQLHVAAFTYVSYVPPVLRSHL